MTRYTIDPVAGLWYLAVLICMARGYVSVPVGALLLTSRLGMTFTWRRG